MATALLHPMSKRHTEIVFESLLDVSRCHTQSIHSTDQLVIGGGDQFDDDIDTNHACKYKEFPLENAVYLRGGEYEGLFQHGMKNHFGIYVYRPSGDVYVGEWRNDTRFGYGRYTWNLSAGHRFYEGEFEKGQRHGFGKHVWCNGDVYEGGWRDGKMYGDGTYWHPFKIMRF